jgi:hypothetical protein
MSVTITVGQQGPQGIPGPAGAPIAGVVNATISGILSALQSLTLFTNNSAVGEIDLDLPAAPLPFQPLTFSLLLTAAQTFSLVASTGVTITNGSDSSSVGGSISSNTLGNFVTLVLVSPTQWVVTSITGIWNLA